MEVVQHHTGLEVASPQQQYADTSTQPNYSKQYYPQASATSPSYFTQPPPPPASHAPSHIPRSRAPTDVWDGKKRKGRSWLLPAAIAAAVAAIVVGGAIAGGLGATLSSCRADLKISDAALSAAQAQGSPATGSNSSTTSTTTDFNNYVVPSPDKVTKIATNCDALAQGNQASWQSAFKVTCGIDIGSGNAKNSAGQDVVVADVGALIAYSFQTCIDACSSYTKMNQGRTGATCQAVTYRWEMAGWYNSPDHANCWLKNSTVDVRGSDASTELLLSANLIS